MLRREGWFFGEACMMNHIFEDLFLKRVLLGQHEVSSHELPWEWTISPFPIPKSFNNFCRNIVLKYDQFLSASGTIVYKEAQKIQSCKERYLLTPGINVFTFREVQE